MEVLVVAKEAMMMVIGGVVVNIYYLDTLQYIWTVIFVVVNIQMS